MLIATLRVATTTLVRIYLAFFSKNGVHDTNLGFQTAYSIRLEETNRLVYLKLWASDILLPKNRKITRDRSRYRRFSQSIARGVAPPDSAGAPDAWVDLLEGSH